MEEAPEASMAAQPEHPRTDQVRKAIVRLTNDSWENGQQVLLFSRLGTALSKLFNASVREIFGPEKLSEFVARELPNEVKRVVYEGVSSASGLIPADANLGVDPKAHFFRSDAQSPKKSRATIHFHPVLWKAFGWRLAPDHVRYIAVKPRVEFRDGHPDEAIFPLAIPRDKIVNFEDESAGDSRATRIYNNILGWLKENNIAIDDVTEVEREHRAVSTAGLSRIQQLIALLPAEDLRRIQLPLDVIQKLLGD